MSQSRGLPLHSVVFAEACFVRVTDLYRAFIDHRSAFIACWASDVGGTVKMFALSSAVPLHLIL